MSDCRSLMQSILCNTLPLLFVHISPDCCSSFCRANAQQPKLFVGMILILIFAEALALYGLIGAIFFPS